MPSFDFSSEVDMLALKNAIDVAGKKIVGRHDFKGTSAEVELGDKEKLITLYADSEFQLKQIKDILYPEMEKKEPDCTKRLDDQAIQKLLNDHPAPPAGLGIAAISAPVLVTIMIPAPPVAARRARRARRHHPQPIHGH